MSKDLQERTIYRDGSSSGSQGDDDDEEDEDLDDLDDVLASFNKPHSSTNKGQPASSTAQMPATHQPSMSQPSHKKTAQSSNATIPDGNDVEKDEEEFDASLIEGMESLLRQLANEHPPGPMPDFNNSESGSKSKRDAAKSEPRPGETGEATGSGVANRDGSKGGPLSAMSAEEEQKAWEKAIQMMLSGEGLEALGLEGEDDQDGSQTASGPAPSSARAGGPEASDPSDSASAKAPSPVTTSAKHKPTASTSATSPLSFEETIRQSMASLDSASSSKTTDGKKGKGAEDDFAKLLAQLQNDPSFLDNFGKAALGEEDGDGGDLGGLLDGMMSQLMTREVLEEPMAELASKYPAYLASLPANTPTADLRKYHQQHQLVKQIVSTFRKSGYSDEKDGKEIARLVGEMQDVGGPPPEIMGDLPEGLDLGALGGDDKCSIM